MAEEGDLHPIELIAHSVLSGPLDSLNENFHSLHKSQVVLLTRLKLIEEQLQQYKDVVDESGNKDVTALASHVKAIKKRLEEVDKKLDVITKRVDAMEN